MSSSAALGQVVAAYAHTDLSCQIARMLDASINEYHLELEGSTGDRTAALQVAIRQCRSIKAVLEGVPHADPRV